MHKVQQRFQAGGNVYEGSRIVGRAMTPAEKLANLRFSVDYCLLAFWAPRR